MNYHNRPKRPKPDLDTQKVQGETHLRVLQSAESGWKVFGDFSLPVETKEFTTASETPGPFAITTTTQRQAPAALDIRAPDPLIRNTQKSQTGSFYAIQEWEGYVSGIDGKYLYAELVDLVTQEKRPTTHAKIPLPEIPETEMRWAVLGAIFRWSIGYRRSMAGQKDRVSRIRFRLLKSRPKSEIRRIEKQTEELANYFSNNS
jgi:hypothetical protein